jgi:hypothetical protein
MSEIAGLPQILEIPIVIGAMLLVCAVIAAFFRYTSYWNRIERLYRVKEKPTLELDTRIESIRIETPIDPSSMLNSFAWTTWIGATASGVYLATIFPLGWILRPVLIPWADIAMTGLGQTELSFLKLPNVTILLRPEMARCLIGHFEAGS